MPETELRHLAAVPYQIISAENNTPIETLIKDYVSLNNPTLFILTPCQ